MILAAGLGLRARPLTLLRAKPVLPVLNRPLLHWTLEALASCGVRDVLINVHHLPRTVVRAVGDGRALGLRVTYSHERRVLGTGGGPRRVRRFFGDEPFLLVNGDVVFDLDLDRLVERHRSSGARATLGLKPNPDPRRYARVVTDAGGRVLSLAGLPRPARGTSSLFTGVHVLDPVLLEHLPSGPSDIVRDLYAPLLARGERLMGVRLRGRWYDFGSPALYLGGQMALLRARFGGTRASPIHRAARVARTARVTRSVLGPAVQVGERAVVTGSVLWEGAVVGPGAIVRQSILTSGVRVDPGKRVERKVGMPGRRGPVWLRLA
jgi:mannose-1-phosphate guanylyltransferase